MKTSSSGRSWRRTQGEQDEHRVSETDMRSWTRWKATAEEALELGFSRLLGVFQEEVHVERLAYTSVGENPKKGGSDFCVFVSLEPAVAH